MGSPRVAVVYSDRYVAYDFGRGHPLKAWRWKLAHALMEAIGLIHAPNVQVHEPYEANRGDLFLFHIPRYVEVIKAHSALGVGILDGGDTPAFKGCYEAARLMVGASLKAAELVMSGHAEVAFNFGGGFHHAHPDRASGFCIFNDVAVCIAYLKKRFGLERIMYVDVDAHHGDGVMFGFYSDPAVLDVDFHESGLFLFPGTGFPSEAGEGPGRGYKVNVPLPPATGDGPYLKAFRRLVWPLAEAYRPQVILAQCGVDAHFHDGLAHLALSTAAYVAIAQELQRLAGRYTRGRLIMLGGGGYHTPTVAKCWALMLALVVGVEPPQQAPETWLELCKQYTGAEVSPPMFEQAPTEPSTQKSVEAELDRVLAAVKRSLHPALTFE